MCWIIQSIFLGNLHGLLMAYISTLLILPFCINCKEDLNPIDPECFQPGKPKRCCTDYRTIAGKCHACIGSFGIECVRPCPSGYHGIKCSEKCLCDECNSTNGVCFNVTGTGKNENTTRPGIWIPVLLAVLFSLGAIVVLFTFLIKRTLRKKETGPRFPEQTQKSEESFEECDYDVVI
eukprot:XP_011447484.2 PREDICTED: uncharacterized protein LOC105342286 [Crassostrea gigas]